MKPLLPWITILLSWCAAYAPCPLCAAVAPPQKQFIVATTGNDHNPGTLNKPFATLERARDAIRELKLRGGLPTGGVTVSIRGGTYALAKTFELSEQDAGTQTAPIVYRPYRNEDVHLAGGKEISGFTPVTDSAIINRLDKSARDHVLQVDLLTHGITDFGGLNPRGIGKQSIPSALELFFNDKPMTLSRWPNTGWTKIAATPAGPKGGRFTYKGNRPSRWAQAEDIWLHGYWTWDWADSYVNVQAIDTRNREIVTKEPHGAYGYKPEGRYYAFNILEELDEPGEWYLDRKSGILYFWPPAPITRGKAIVSRLPTVIALRATSHVTIQGITVECCRGTAITVAGGTDNRIAGCTIRNAGTDAVKIAGGARNGVVGCDIYQCGECGIRLGGGDRKKLLPAGNYVVNTRIHDISQWVRTYVPGIAIDGVGNRIANNLIYNAPHSAILLHGNDHLIEYNEIHHACLETADSGAFYMGRDYAERGNVVRFNYFHHLNMGDVQAIYLDDFTSGTTVYGNVIHKAGRGVFISGGRDNIIRNNIFVDCDKYAIHLDARGLAGSKKYFDGTDTTLTDRLKAVNYKEPPYRTRYPGLTTLYDGNPAQPEGNVFANNIVYRCKLLELTNGLTTRDVTLEGNLVEGDPIFVDYGRNDFQLKPTSPAFKLGFKRIPMEKIGLFKNEFRK